jgi:hypothetical protein
MKRVSLAFDINSTFTSQLMASSINFNFFIWFSDNFGRNGHVRSPNPRCYLGFGPWSCCCRRDRRRSIHLETSVLEHSSCFIFIFIQSFLQLQFTDQSTVSSLVYCRTLNVIIFFL